MGFYKLREWVGTETGKGDRLGGRQLGRSEPAFQVASTTALPPPTSMSRQMLANFICWLLFAARPVPATSSAGCFYCKACAGRIVCQLLLLQGLCRSDRLPAVFACNGLICHALPAHLCHAMPTAHIHQPPFCSAFPRPLFIAMCARIVAQFARTALSAATTRACSGGPCTVFASSDHRACCRDCPVCSLITGLQWRPVHRVFVSIHPSMHRSLRVSLELTWRLHLRSSCAVVSAAFILEGGRSWTACEQPATFPVTCIA